MPAPPPGRRAAYLRSLVAHYYGNEVRVLFVICAVLLFVLTPIFGNILPGTIYFIPLSSAILLLLAALTNPKVKWVIAIDCIAAGAFLVFVEVAALRLYTSGSSSAFVAREVIGLMFMLALYFSLKTAYAMRFHRIGKTARPNEFDTE